MFTIESSAGSGVPGWWHKVFAVQGGTWYEFSAECQALGVINPGRSLLVRLTWLNKSGEPVVLDPDGVLNAADVNAKSDVSRPIYPAMGEGLATGWRPFRGRYQAPQEATGLKVELELRWSPRAIAHWGGVRLVVIEAPKPRRVRLAAVHFTPTGKTPAENLRQYEPLIRQAGEGKADLVVLGETLTLINTGLHHRQVAETLPGPSTRYLGELASKYKLYIVAGLVELEGQTVYNTAVLLGPDGSLVGRYRKVCIPREESDQGVFPGEDYPVFETRFGKLGMMVCWDLHFPEVARNLAGHGAEVIAVPIWGGMPSLAIARAVENQVFVVTSTYSDHGMNWMKTGVWTPAGRLLSPAREWGTVVINEVVLGEVGHWWGLGDFRGRIASEKPVGFNP